MFVYLFVYFWARVQLWCSGWSPMPLFVILFLQPPETWDYRQMPVCQMLSSVFNASFFTALKPENPHGGYFTLRWTNSIFSVPHKNKNSKRRKRMLHYWNQVMIFSSQTYITDISKALFLDLTGKKGRNGTSLGISELLLCTLVKGFQSDLPSRNSLSTSLRN